MDNCVHCGKKPKVKYSRYCVSCKAYHESLCLKCEKKHIDYRRGFSICGLEQSLGLPRNQ